MKWDKMVKYKNEEIERWVRWLDNHGGRLFLEHFLNDAQNARGTCKFCSDYIYLDVIEGGGIADWRTSDGDYGCEMSPETSRDSLGSHKAIKLGDWD